ncbi:MAG: molybdopterin-guanine dinucleotide biosynthesis protein B [Gemmatimonadaceae bacterium]
MTIIGTKKQGKTTLTVKLAAELHRRGHRVMTMKHGSHTFNIDPSTTDTYKHYHEGHAERVAMVSPDKFALVERWTEERGPEEIAELYLAEADIVIAEGFKAAALPKIEIWRKETGKTPLYEAGSAASTHYIAIATDDPSMQATATPVPVVLFSEPDWLTALADLIETKVMHT